MQVRFVIVYVLNIFLLFFCNIYIFFTFVFVFLCAFDFAQMCGNLIVCLSGLKAMRAHNFLNLIFLQ